MAAPVVVQSAFNDSGFNTPYDVVLAAAPTEGNTLVAFLWQRNASGTSSSSWTPTSISGGTWTLDAQGNGYDAGQYGGPGGCARLVAYSRPVGAAESATITVTPGSGVTACLVVEVAGSIAQVITTDSLTLTSSSNHDMTAAVTDPSLMLVAWGMQRTEYAPADSIAADVGVTEIRDAYPPSNASPHCWVAHRSIDGPGTLTVGGTPAFNPNLNKWGVFSVAYTFEGTTHAVEPKVTFTINSVEFTGLLSKELRVELNGTGYVHFSISRGDAQATEANLARGNLIQVTIPEIHSGVLVEAILEEGDFDLLSSDEEGGQELQFGGPGTLSVLRRSVIAYEEYLDGTGQWKPNKGRVVFDADVTEGHIVNKLIREAQAAGRPSDPIPMVTKTFDATDDSNGDPWGDETLEGNWKVPMGAVLYDEVLRLVRAGLLHVEMAPGFELNLYRTMGTDRTSGTFAAGKVRFVGGVNIAEGLARGMAGRDFVTHAYIRYGDGDWTNAAKLVGSFPYEQEMFFDAGNTSHANTARRAARGEMGWRETTQEALLLAHIVPWPGDAPDDATGLYLPGPTWSDNGRYWVGDLVTVDTGSGEFDYDNATHRVYAITLREDATGHLAPPILELNAPYLSADAASSGLTASPIAGGATGSGGTIKADLGAYQQIAEKGEADGYAELGATGIVPYAQLGSGGDGSGDNTLRDDGTWGPAASSEDASLNTVAAAGSTETLDVSVARTHEVTLTADCDVTLAGWSAGARYATLWFTEDATGGWTPDLLGVVWPDPGTPPAWDTAPNARFGVTVYSADGGTTVYAIPVGGGSSTVLSDATPEVELGAGSAGTSVEASRSDHVHPTGGAGASPTDTHGWMPLTTVVGGAPELVWDADDSLIPDYVPF